METSSASSIPGPRCCCGSADCVYLAHNGRLLEGLEHNVSRAAQLGQVRVSSQSATVTAFAYVQQPLSTTTPFAHAAP
jgi:hypothetical protein